MIGLRTTLLLPALALALASCASPVGKPSAAETTAPATKAPPAAEKPKYKKPPRMNGRGEVTSISLEQFFLIQQSDKALIFDARPSFFYNLGHIPGAINMPKNNCDEAINAREAEIKAAIANGKTLVVYCSSITCPDARSVAIHLSGFGYPASIFSGGWDAWKNAEMPTE
jgi:rhodanese-related sulfurtransferase